MLATPRTGPPLATAHDLAEYHAERERLYAAAVLLLDAAPDPRVLTAVRHLLRRDAAVVDPLKVALSDSRGARAGDAYARLFEGAHPAIKLRCHTARWATHDEAFTAAGVPLSPDVRAELRALAVLADRTAHALDDGDMSAAAALSDVQARFLRHHAGACVSELAMDLIQSGEPFYLALGGTLAEQIAEDLRLLASD